MKIRKNPTYCNCCVPTGLYDWYGKCRGGGHPASPLFYRTGTVRPYQWGAGEYSYETDPHWSVTYTEGSLVNEGTILTTCGIFGTPKCWVTRGGNADHPDAGWEKVDGVPGVGAWTELTDGDYRASSDRLETLVDTPTSQAGISTSRPDIGDYLCRVDVAARKDAAHYLKISVTNINAAGDDAEIVVDMNTKTIVSQSAPVTIAGGAAVFPDNDGEFDWSVYRMYFISEIGATSGSFSIRLCNSSGGNYTGAIESGCYVSFATISKLSEGSFAGNDLSLVDAAIPEISLFRPLSCFYYAAYVEQWIAQYATVPVLNAAGDATGYYRGVSIGGQKDRHIGSTWTGGSGGMGPEGAGAYMLYQSDGATPPTFSTFDEHLNPLFSHEPTMNSGLNILFANSPFGWMTLAASVSDIPHPDDEGGSMWAYIPWQDSQVDIVVGWNQEGDTTKRWGMSIANKRLELPPIIYWNGVTDSDEIIHYDGGEEDWVQLIPPPQQSMPYIVAASPHGYPNVWSIQPAKRDRFAVTSDGRAGQYDTQADTHTCVLRHGPVAREYVTIRLSEVFMFTVQLPILKGSGTTYWSKTKTPTYAHYIEHNTDYWQLPFPTVWCNLIRHDAIGATGIALFQHGENSIQQVADRSRPGYVGHEDPDHGNPDGNVNVITSKFWVQVQYNGNHPAGGNMLLYQEVWRAGEAHLGNNPSDGWAWCSTVGVASDSGDKYPVWTERLWETAPSEASPGVPYGWRLHGKGWTMDADERPNPSYLTCFPEFIQSSDRFIYISNFKLCDPRMNEPGTGVGGVGVDWAISHDGTAWWPLRNVSDPALDNFDQSSPIMSQTTTMLTDCIKDSYVLYCPTTSSWAHRVGLWWYAVDDPLTSWAAGSHASYSSSKLSLSSSQTNTNQAELVYGAAFAAANINRYRVMVQAKDGGAGQCRNLMFQWDDFAGSGDHARAWLRLESHAFGASDNIDAGSTSVSDKGGGIYEYSFELERCNDTILSNFQRIRLVDGSGDDNFTGDSGDGAFIYTLTIQRTCADCS